jgi:cytochrome c55X
MNPVTKTTKWVSGLIIFLLSLPVLASSTISSDRQAELLHLLKHDCGSCHGMTLQGGLGPALTPQALAGKAPALLQQTVLDGRTGTAMPPWRGLLSAPEVAWLVDRLIKGETDER